VARPLWTVIRVARASVRTVRLGRSAAGCRSAALLGHLVAPGTILLGTVEVVVRRQAGGGRRRHERLGQLVHPLEVLHPQRAANAVVRRRAADLVLGAPEVWQQVRVPPAGRAVLVPPPVVVQPVPADVDHRVDRRAAAEHPAAWPVQPAVVQLFLLLRAVVPVPLGLEQPVERGRDVHLVGVVGRPCLQQQHPHAGILGEPASEHAPGAPGPDDDVVEGRALGHGSPCAHGSPPCSLRSPLRCDAHSRVAVAAGSGSPDVPVRLPAGSGDGQRRIDSSRSG